MVETRNIFHKYNLDEAVQEMKVTARQRERLEKEAYHVPLSYHPNEEISDEEMIEDIEAFLERRAGRAPDRFSGPQGPRVSTRTRRSEPRPSERADLEQQLRAGDKCESLAGD